MTTIKNVVRPSLLHILVFLNEFFSMFEEIKEYLNSLTHEQKQDMINNLKEFARLRSLLTAKGVIRDGDQPNKILIVADHPLVEDFKSVYHKMTLQGVELIDERK